MRKSYLASWKERLGLKVLSDVGGILGRVERVLRELEATGRTPKTRRNYAESLAAFCDWCVLRGYLDEDPLKGMASFDTSPRTRRRAMTSEEVARLRASCRPRRRLVYELAFTSGLRAGELQSLCVRHLDRVAGGLRLDAAWTKNRKEAFQPLPTWLVEQLAEVSAGKPLDARLVYVPTHPARDFDDDLEKAGVPKKTEEGKLDFHACRVAYVTWVVESGATVKEAQTLARHSTAELTVNTYARARSDRLAEVADVVGQKLRTSIAGAQQNNGVVLSALPTASSGEWRGGSIPAASTKRSQGMKRGKAEPLTGDIPELTARDFAHGIPRKQLERIRRGQIAGGDDIIALRRFTGLTQEEFARALAISVHTLRNWEQGRRTPEGPALALLRIAARHPRVLRENLAVPP